MSRSQKKTPYAGDNKGKSKKRAANQSVRAWLKNHPEEKLDGGQYKKIYDSYDICDFYWIYTWDEYWEKCWNWYVRECKLFPHKDIKEPDYKTEYRKWKHTYKNK